MGRQQNTHVVVTGNGNDVASTNTSESTVTINGQTFDLTEGGTVVVDGNTVSTGRRR